MSDSTRQIPREPGPWDRWEKTRQIGKKAFIWRYGVLGWGLLMALFMLGVIIADSRNHPNFWLLCLILPVLFPVAGYLWGVLVWNQTEQKYQAYAMLREVYDTLRHRDST